MITLIIILAMMAIVLSIALAVSMKSDRKGPDDGDREYINEDGDHVYYNESLIAKKDFQRKNPGERVRTWRRLFRRK